MPTTRARLLVTETDDLAAALDIAAAHWPGLSRPQLLVKLAITAAEPLGALQRTHRLAVLDRLTEEGIPGLTYPAGYLDELRADWPE